MTWNTDSLWFEVDVVTIFFLLDHIFFGHVEERSPKGRKLLKYVVTLIVIISISIFFDRTTALAVLGLSVIPVFYIHGILWPKKGINGWTGEPKSKYHEFRGWSKDIFGDDILKSEE